jgi:iron complex outermembrane receptor protein
METLDGKEGALEANNREVRRFINIFAKADYNLNPHLKLSGGANLHFLKYSLTDRFENDTNHSGAYRYNPIFSPRLGLNWAMNPKMNLFAAIGHGFSVPTVEETLLPEGNINPHLKPEEGINSEAGIRGTAFNQRLTFDITIYRIYLKNLLVTQRESESVFYGINAGETKHYGLEIELKNYWPLAGNPESKIEFELTHTQMRNQFESFINDGQNYGGNRLPGIPNQMTHLAFSTILRNHFFGRLTWAHTGNQYLNDANTLKYNGHTLLNLQFSATLMNNPYFSWELQTGINNVLDTHYASMVVVNAPSFGGGAPRYYYPGMPRNAFIRLIIKVHSS